MPAFTRTFAQSEVAAFVHGLEQSVHFRGAVAMIGDDARIRGIVGNCVLFNFVGLGLASCLLSWLVQWTTATVGWLSYPLSVVPIMWATAVYIVTFPANILWGSEVFDAAYKRAGYTAAAAGSACRGPLELYADQMLAIVVVLMTCLFQALAFSVLPAIIEPLVIGRVSVTAWTFARAVLSFLYEALTYGYCVFDPRQGMTAATLNGRIEWFEKRPAYFLGIAMPGILPQVLAQYLGGTFMRLAVYAVVYPLHTAAIAKADVSCSRVADSARWCNRLPVFAVPTWMARALLRKRRVVSDSG